MTMDWRATLKEKREMTIRQRDHALSLYQQSIGALTILDHLIELDTAENGIPIQDFASALGADSAEVVKVEDQQTSAGG